MVINEEFDSCNSQSRIKVAGFPLRCGVSSVFSEVSCFMKLIFQFSKCDESWNV